MIFRIVETDKHGSQHRDEKALKLPLMTEAQAYLITDAINSVHCNNSGHRFWKVVPHDYELQASRCDPTRNEPTRNEPTRNETFFY